MTGKKKREAAALEYDASKGAPKIIAQGKGLVAEQIIGKAKEHNIPVYEDPELAHALNLLRIGDEIPPELYAVVAQILVFVAEADMKAAASHSGLR
ncbi:MAG: EscU/YscU/HrcU family type III secretion system export apparatus switch protein [Oscillospiraceae bacterium]|jgi:flagellar biosynthesis protein|nr:EscU/YscU/HrcU family type III secretion system export apparatus switch protein [Oscillospiraceae bacterium]